MTTNRFPRSVVFGRTGAAFVTLVTALSLAACASSGGSTTGPGGSATASTPAGADGKVATTEVCQEVATQITTLAAPLLPLLAGNASGAQLQTDIAQVKAAVASWAAQLQAEAAKAQDSTVANDLNSAASSMTSTVATAFSGDQNAMALQTAVVQIQTAASGLYLDCPQLPKLTG